MNQSDNILVNYSEPCSYNGYNFRSKLEARWAYFFDQLEISWFYEKYFFTMPNGNGYLPDFYLPEFGWFVEVKGDLHPANIHKIMLGALSTKAGGLQSGQNSPLILLSDIPNVENDDDSVYVRAFVRPDNEFMVSSLWMPLETLVTKNPDLVDQDHGISLGQTSCRHDDFGIECYPFSQKYIIRKISGMEHGEKIRKALGNARSVRFT